MKPIALLAALLIALMAGNAPSARAAIDDDAKAALEAFERQDFKTAVDLLDKVLADKSLPAQARAAVLVYRGGAKYGLGDAEAAIADFQAAAAADPQSIDAQINLVIVFEEQRKYGPAVQHHRRVLELIKARPLTPEGIGVQNKLAWLLATVPDDTVRDGKAAVALATEAVSLVTTNWPDADKTLVANTYDSLAAAYAEAKRFKEAVATVEKAIAMLDANAAGLKAELQEHLASYQAGKPWRLK